MERQTSWETKVISINQQQTKTLRETYAKSTEMELLTILWDNHLVKPKEQDQQADKIDFNTQIIAEAKQELATKGEDIDSTKVFHNHNEDHWFAFSEADLQTAELLYQTQWINEMWLFKNGKTLENGEVAVQHMIIANHEWKLHDLEWTEWSWKVLTMYTDENWVEQHEYSESIEEAEEKEKQITLLKELLLATEWEELLQAA